MLEKLPIGLPIYQVNTRLYSSNWREMSCPTILMPNNTGYKIYEGIMSLFEYIGIIV
jgi:hypothetical protein